MTNPTDPKNKTPQRPQGHVHGPGCGCGFPLADDGDEFWEDEEFEDE